MTWISTKNYPSSLNRTSYNNIILKFNGSYTTNYFVNKYPFNASTNLFKWLNMQVEAINSTVSFYYIYKYGSNYTQKANLATPMYSVPPVNVGQYSNIINSGNNVINLSYSTQIKNLPIFGNSTVSNVDYIFVAITPNSDLQHGQNYGVNIKSFNFTNFAVIGNYVRLFQNKLANNNGFDTVPHIEYTTLSHTKYAIKVYNASGMFRITLDQSFSPYWIVKQLKNTTSLVVLSHTPYANYGNSWLINATGNFTIMIYFSPQTNLFGYGLISIASILSELCAMYFLIVYQKKKY